MAGGLKVQMQEHGLPAAAASDIELEVEHQTDYQYAEAVQCSHHIACLQPLQDEHQQVQQFVLQIDPPPALRRGSLDAWGNARAYFEIHSPHRQLRVGSRLCVRVRDRHAGLDAARSPAWESVRDALAPTSLRGGADTVPFTLASALVPLEPQLAAYAQPSFPPGRPLAEAALELMQRIHADFRYLPASTDVHTPVLQAFERRVGVCQDFSQVMIGALRALGLAARYVSGYLLMHQPGADPTSAPMVGAQASHAWVSVHVPETPGVPGGWLDLDPTNACVPGAGHVRLALGRDFADVTPLRGVIRGGGAHSLQVQVQTRQRSDSPAAPTAALPPTASATDRNNHDTAGSQLARDS
jgi:transglutaminase-like putative cysteine protease